MSLDRQARPTGKTRFHLFKALVLPLVLLLLPTLILWQGARWEQEQRLRERQRQWQDEADTAAGKLQQAMTAGFWVEHSARQLVQVVARQLEKSSPSVSSLVLGETVGEALAEVFPIGVPEFRVWAIPLAGEDKNLPTLCEGEGLETQSSRLFSRLLLEMARSAAGNESELALPLWKQRLEQLFGYGCSEHFHGPFRGRSFTVVYQGQCGTAYWDFFTRQGKNIGLFLAISPLNDDRGDLLSSLAFRWWWQVGGKNAPLPVLIPVPTPAVPHPSALIHPDIGSPGQVEPLVRRVLERSHLAPGIPWREDYIRGLIRREFKTARQAGNHFLGQVQLPVDLIREEISTSNEEWFGTLLPPILRQGKMVLMVKRKPPVPAGILEFLAWLLAGWWLTVLFALTTRAWLGKLPTLSARASLLLWFLGLVAIPLSHSLVVLAQWKTDYQQLLMGNLRESLFRKLNQVESGYMAYQRASQKTCGDFFEAASREKGLGKHLWRVQFEKADPEPVKQEIWEFFHKRGIPLSALLVMGHDGFLLRQFDPALDQGAGRSLEIMVRSAVETELAKNRPRLLATPGPASMTVSTLARITRKSDYGRQHLSQIVEWGAGSRKAQGYSEWVKVNGECWFIVYALWNTEALKNRYLQEFTSSGKEEPDCHILVRSGNSWIPRPGDRVPSGLLDQAQGMGERIGQVALERGEYLQAFHTGNVLPGHLLITRAGTGRLRAQIRQELAVSLSVWALLATGVTLGVWLVSRGLTDRVVRMTTALKRVAADNLEQQLDAERPDELGETAASLNTMIGWLRERRNMSRFVSPVVLDAVRERDHPDNSLAVRRQVVILVSDIRAFTTMTERFPPYQVFDLLNEHLKRMTKAIQKHGGMIDRFIGDAIQAVFPGETVEVALAHAAGAAQDMRLAHQGYSRERARTGQFPYEIGIGLAGGEVVAGVVGDRESRLDFSLVGAPLQQAAQLESLSRYGQDSRIVLAASEVASLPPGHVVLPLPGYPEACELKQTLERTTGTDEGATKSQTGTTEQQGSQNVESGEASSRPVFWVIFLLLWFLPPCIVLGFHWWAHQRHEKTVREVFERTLARDERRIRAVVGGVALLEWHLQQSLEKRSGLDEGKPASGSQVISPPRERLAELERDLPGLSWFWGQGESVLASGGADLGYPAGPADALMRSVYSEFFLTDGARGNDEGIAGAAFGLESYLRKDLGYLLCGRLIQVKTPVGTRWMFWKPLMRDGFIAGAKNLNSFSPAPRGREFFGTRAEYAGDMVLFLTDDAVDRSRPLRRRSMETAFQELGVSVFTGDSAAVPDRRTEKEDRKSVPPDLLKQLRERVATGAILTQDGWMVTRPERPLDDGVPLILARRMPAMAPAWLQHLILSWGAGWLLCGAWLGSALWKGGCLSLRLRSSMILAFGLALTPALLLSLTNVERRWAGQEARAADSLEERLEQQFRRVEDSYHLTEESCGQCIRSVFSLPEIRARLAAMNGENAEGRAEGWIPFMRKLIEVVRRYGWFMNTPRMVISSGEIFSGQEQRRVARKIEGREALLQFVGRRLMSQWRAEEVRPSGREKVSQVLVEANAEDALAMFRGFSPPDDVPGLLLLPYSGVRPWNQGESALMMLVPGKGQELSWFFSSLPNAAFWRPHFQMWASRLASSSLRVGGVFAVLPQTRFGDPAIIATVTDTQGEKLDMRSFLIPQGVVESWGAMLAAITGEGICIHQHGAHGEEDVLLRPSRLLDGLLIRVSASTAGEKKRESRARLVDLAAPGLILGLGLLLALVVAQTWMLPLLRLRSASEAMIQERFETRLEIEGGNEFADLAMAFNRMAQGVVEGRELSRYVSLSVRQAARTEAGAGLVAARQVDAVVIFGALHGFSGCAETLPPEELMRRLSRHLASWASAVRSAGGEVDKFVGERILGVFSPERLGGTGPAVAAAFAAAQAMVSRASLSGLGDHAGLGIAFGPVLSGIMGTPEVRLEYTVVGDTVNLASRLADVALKQDAGGIVVDAAFREQWEKLPGFGSKSESPRNLDIRQVKGKSREVDIYFFPAESVLRHS